MEVKLLPQDVADAFVKQYYTILERSPDNVHKFYKEPSLLSWPGADGDVTPVTTLSGINAKIVSNEFKNCTVELKTIDAQPSADDGFIVAVTGYSTDKDNVERIFSQTFFLAKQEKGFFVLNDILRFFDVCQTIIETAPEDVDEDSVNDQPQEPPAMETSEKPAAPLDIPVNPPSPKHTKAVIVEDVIVKEESFPSLKESVAKIAASKASVAKKSPSKSSVASLEKPLPVVAPVAPNVKEDSKKTTYASMVAKEAPVTSPRAATVVTSNAYSQAVASPKAKSSAPLSDVALKSPPLRAVSQAPVASNKLYPRLATKWSNGEPNADVRGIYIARLPYDITKQGILEVVTQFGPVLRNADPVQIRKHEDGFCCGFVDFESADSARRAVEAHRVYFGEKESYITYKKSNYNRVAGNDGRGCSPKRTGAGNGYFRGNAEGTSDGRVQNDNRAGNNKGSARSPRRNR